MCDRFANDMPDEICIVFSVATMAKHEHSDQRILAGRNWEARACESAHSGVEWRGVEMTELGQLFGARSTGQPAGDKIVDGFIL